jgi:hypothetical protein
LRATARPGATISVCPSCRSEYVPGITRCSSCQVDLVDPSALVEETVGDNPRELLKEAEKAFLGARNLDAARELERDLLEAGILCYVHAEQTEGALMSAGSIQYTVAFAQEDVPSVKELLEGRVRGLMEQEGLAALSTQAVDLEADEVTCPACGHTGALDDEGACADCGLVLGVG